jgi:ribosomal protein L13E
MKARRGSSAERMQAVRRVAPMLSTADRLQRLQLPVDHVARAQWRAEAAVKERAAMEARLDEMVAHGDVLVKHNASVSDGAAVPGPSSAAHEDVAVPSVRAAPAAPTMRGPGRHTAARAAREASATGAATVTEDEDAAVADDGPGLCGRAAVEEETASDGVAGGDARAPSEEAPISRSCTEAQLASHGRAMRWLDGAGAPAASPRGGGVVPLYRCSTRGPDEDSAPPRPKSRRQSIASQERALLANKAPSLSDVTVLHAAGLSGARRASQMRAMHYSVKDLLAAGFSAAEAKEGGYSAQQLHDAGASADDLRTAAFSAADLRAAGYAAAQAGAAGFSLPTLRKAGYSDSELRSAGWRASQLRVAGASVDELLAAGCPLEELRRPSVGLSHSQLEALARAVR